MRAAEAGETARIAPATEAACRGFAPALPGGEAALGTLAGGYGASAPTRDAWQLVR